MNSENKVAILVVAFLGVPETSSQLSNSKLRYFYTQNAFLGLQKKVNSQNLFLGLVGDENECARFIYETGLGEKKAKWFKQDRALISKGTGALENQLILNCIKFWSFEQKYDLIIKITGKYDILNLKDILVFSKKMTQPLFAWKIFLKNMVDTRVLIFEPGFYLSNQNSLRLSNLSYGYWIENIIYRLMKIYSLKFGFLFYRPILIGWSGAMNEFSYTPIHKRVLIHFATNLDLWRKSLLHRIN
jgi:hypothetical protein